MAETALITGANRGLGLALTRTLLERGDTVWAACRRPDETEKLTQLAGCHGDRLNVVAMDVTEEFSVSAAVDQVAGAARCLDLLVNNAAVFADSMDDDLDDWDLALTRQAFETNTLGSVRVTRACRALLRESPRPRVINVTSTLGSITLEADRGSYAYGPSKCAMNYLTRTLAAKLAGEGIVVVAVHPGWMQTRMGGPGAEIDPAESAEGIVRLADGLTADHAGTWFECTGRPIRDY